MTSLPFFRNKCILCYIEVESVDKILQLVESVNECVLFILHVDFESGITIKIIYGKGK